MDIDLHAGLLLRSASDTMNSKTHLDGGAKTVKPKIHETNSSAIAKHWQAQLGRRVRE